MRHVAPSLYATALVASLAALSATPARADERDPTAAESLFRSARAAVDRGDYATACPQFAESQRLDPAPGTLMNLADCEEHVGRTASAWQHFVQAKEQLKADDDRVPFVQQRIAALEPRVPHVVVRLKAGTPAGAKVLRDKLVLGQAVLGTSLAIDPGAYTFTVLAPERVARKLEVTLKEGETKELELEAGDPERAQWPTVVASPVPQAPAPEAPPPPSDGSGKRTAAFVAGGIGAAGIVVGSVTGILAFGAAGTYKDNCTANGACNAQGLDAASSGKTFSTVSTVAFVVGAVGLGAGAYLFLTSGPSAPARTTVGVAALPGGAALSLRGGF